MRSSCVVSVTRERFVPQASAPCAVQGSRHDAQVAVFGRSVQAKLEAQRLFLVGTGALGCEFLKVGRLKGYLRHQKCWTSSGHACE